MAATQDQLTRQARYAIRLAFARRWVNRRVETFTFLDAGTVRRRMSVDLTLERTESLQDGDIAVVPLMMLVKENLRNLDVRGHDGHPLPVFSTAQNAEIAILGVKGHLVALLSDTPISSSEKQIDAEPLREIVEAPNDDGCLAQKHLDESGALGGPLHYVDPVVRVGIERLIRELERSFLLLVPLTYQPDERVIAKVSYDVALGRQRGSAPSKGDLRFFLNRAVSSIGLIGRAEVFDNLAVGLCESYHAEVIPPRDVYVAEPALTVLREGAKIEDDPELDEHKFRPHMHVSPTARGDTGTLSLIFHAYRQELLLPLAFSGVLISAILGLIPARVYSLDGQTLAALLLVPFALSAYYIRGQENSYATHMLIGVRLLALLPLGAALAALTLVALGRIPPAKSQMVSPGTFDLLQVAFLFAAFPTGLLLASVGSPPVGRVLRRKIRAVAQSDREAERRGEAHKQLGRRLAAAVAALVVIAAIIYGCYSGATIWLETRPPSEPVATITS